MESGDFHLIAVLALDFSCGEFPFLGQGGSDMRNRRNSAAPRLSAVLRASVDRPVQPTEPALVQPPEWRSALDLWLRWNAAFESATEELYKAGSDARQIEQTMDRMDAMRREAAMLSARLLSYARAA
jgi:hypothetical protein